MQRLKASRLSHTEAVSLKRLAAGAPHSSLAPLESTVAKQHTLHSTAVWCARVRRLGERLLTEFDKHIQRSHGVGSLHG